MQVLKLPLLGVSFCTSHYLMSSIATGGFVRSDIGQSFMPIHLFMPWSIPHAIYNFNKTDGVPSYLPFLGAGIMNAWMILNCYSGIKAYQEYKDVFCNLAHRMKDVQIFIRTIQQVSNIVADYKELELVYGPSLQEVRTLLAHSQEQTDIGTMLRSFLDMKFDNWSYMYDNGGKLLATYYLFEEHKSCLHPAMYELGKLDSMIGIATLMQEAKQSYPAHCYTFAKLLTRAEQPTPFIQLHAMWNPLLDPAVVVDNEVALDTNQVRNMILCGPNAGGKSVFIMGVAMSLLLSQTFGIVPAQHGVITPFNKMRTYMEMGGNVESGASLFMVEVDRMQQYLHILEQSQPDEFIFAIADEPFSGTNPAEASAAAYSLLAYMAKYTNAIHIVTSHYPIVMELAHNVKDRGIKNFKVFTEETTDRKIHYTYKVVPGSSTQSIALKILEQEGFDKSMITQAEYLMKHRREFYKNFGSTLPKSKSK